MTGWSACASSWTCPPPHLGVGAVPPDPLAPTVVRRRRDWMYVVARGRVRLDEHIGRTQGGRSPRRDDDPISTRPTPRFAEQHRVRHQLVSAGRGLGQRRRLLDLPVSPAPPSLLLAALLAQPVDDDEELVVEALLRQRRLDAYRSRDQTNRKLRLSATTFCETPDADRRRR
ncbi:hypothetical protein M885DRAFT_523175, partial [Pelagophyceae sp. CCMP2097]